MGLFDSNQTCPIDVMHLRDLLPKWVFDANDDTTTRFVEIFDPVFCQFINDISNFPNIYNPDVADEVFIDLLFKHLGFELTINLSLNRKRKLVKVVVEAYKQKGTAPGIENVIRQFIGVDVTVFPFTSGWILDVSELGVDTYLNPSPSEPAGYYTFDILVNAKLSNEQRRVIEELVKLMKPAWSHFRTLVENADDTFLLSSLVMLNRGSLFLRNNQNSDGGWDAADPDGNLASASARQNVAREGLGCFYSQLYTQLPSVATTASEAVQYLIDNVTYSFLGTLPEPGDIELLSAGAGSLEIEDAVAKRDEALAQLREFAKACAFLNNPTPSLAALSNTTQQERDTTTAQKQASLLLLNQITVHGMGAGIIRFYGYVRDYWAISDDDFARTMAEQLFVRTSLLNLATDLGQQLIGANAAMIWVLQKANVGLVYEQRIQQAQTVLDGAYKVGDKLYYDTFYGSGRLTEQAIVLDAWMIRQRYDQAKALLDGIRLKQRVDGSFDDPIETGTSRIVNVGRIMDVAGRAIKRIDDDGL